ncbi:N-acetylmuramic acid 6-phosphate etherase [Marinactinospora thermotolerans]|uniref:N-acetylmuramic acid 6-phosphate etherase n=1 Tax=Marinactinospora thermotolerans DSM 45154 TaxID=1122192 RepID=A0A1T4RSX7_9ACTN|nr:N-acetylmuramic acid 6-phosphate etherase [Marinactinospora thermotolerans]SKA19079.1 N-acetylmuramic acid 6-phosphate etherase [Marinactinospora thermotolerans DSM 45154]
METQRPATAAEEAPEALTGPVEIVRVPTEGRNSATLDIDLLPSIEVLRRINAEDATVPGAVAAVLPELARAVDLGVAALQGGGRIHYFGAGTSGRLATMDAAELPPTFGIDGDRVVAHHAGGEDALGRAVEGREDDAELGGEDAARLSAGDLAVGLTASGRTPYVAGALRRAREAGAHTVLITANPHAALAGEADVHVGADTGAEVIAGSTRMKAGTAQKLILNAFSTAVMVRLGHTYSNLMVGVNATNAKLRGRMVTILSQATGLDEETCSQALARTDGDTRTALVCLLADVDAPTAAGALRAAGGSVRTALRDLQNS